MFSKALLRAIAFVQAELLSRQFLSSFVEAMDEDNVELGFDFDNF
ncbi:hypothetical protein [Microcoleus sp. FACHB-831]|nr:hypothetical protein [Microcoleus sp. FACHB-831]